MLDFTCEYTSVLGPFALCQQLPGIPQGAPQVLAPRQDPTRGYGTPLVGTPDRSVACLRVVLLAAE